MIPIVLDLPAIAIAALQSTAVAAALLLAERASRAARHELRAGLIALALAKFAVQVWLVWPWLPAAGGGPAATTDRVATPAALAWLPAALLATWAAGALVALARFAGRRAELFRRVAASASCTDPHALARLAAVAHRAGLRVTPELRVSDTEPAPFGTYFLARL